MPISIKITLYPKSCPISGVMIASVSENFILSGKIVQKVGRNYPLSIETQFNDYQYFKDYFRTSETQKIRINGIENLYQHNCA